MVVPGNPDVRSYSVGVLLEPRVDGKEGTEIPRSSFRINETGHASMICGNFKILKMHFNYGQKKVQAQTMKNGTHI